MGLVGHGRAKPYLTYTWPDSQYCPPKPYPLELELELWAKLVGVDMSGGYTMDHI